jgi:hypothetical protein
MKTEHVYDPPAADGGEGLLAIVLYRGAEDYDAGFGAEAPAAHFLTDPPAPVQVAVMTHPAGHVVEPHAHHARLRTVVSPTQEVLVVTRGRAALTVYNSRGDRVGRYLLGVLDLAILFAGGHRLDALDALELLEIKQGPYLGREQDKFPLTPKE